MREDIIMATSAADYTELVERIAELEAQEKKFLEREQTWVKEIKYQLDRVIQKSIEFERCKSLNSTLVQLLSKYTEHDEIIINDPSCQNDNAELREMCHKVLIHLEESNLEAGLRFELRNILQKVKTPDLFPSPERAKDYIESSTFLRDNFGRKDYGNIDDAQRWYDSQTVSPVNF